MTVYMVERDLPAITLSQLAAAQQAATETSARLTHEGRSVRYIRSTWEPEESRVMCLFEAEYAEHVREANEAA
jgi:hypothetical protein